jgi:hypothetical protein
LQVPCSQHLDHSISYGTKQVRHPTRKHRFNVHLLNTPGMKLTAIGTLRQPLFPKSIDLLERVWRLMGWVYKRYHLTTCGLFPPSLCPPSNEVLPPEPYNMRLVRSLQPEGREYVSGSQQPQTIWVTPLTKSLTYPTTKITRHIDILKYPAKSSEIARSNEPTYSTANCGNRAHGQKVLMRLALFLRLHSKVALTHLTHLHVLRLAHQEHPSAGIHSKCQLQSIYIAEMEAIEIGSQCLRV